MVSSKEELSNAMMKLSDYYDKILLVNLNKDTFRPIKVKTREYQNLFGAITFSEWIEEFSLSPYCNKEECVNFYQFNSLENLKMRTAPAYLKYKKLINGEYHNVIEEIIPLGNGLIYLFVKDLTLMEYDSYYE